nr:hypothetical protein [Tanacetum cinerariifolium]
MELNDQSNFMQPTIPSSIPNEIPTTRRWIIEITLACGYVKEVNAGKHCESRSVGCCNKDDDELTMVKDVSRGSRLGACLENAISFSYRANPREFTILFLTLSIF